MRAQSTREHESGSGSFGAGVRTVPARATSPAAGVRGGGRLDRAAILSLQRSAGNAAVTRLLQRYGPGDCSCGGVCGKVRGREDPSELKDDLRGRPTLEGSRLLTHALRRMVGQSSGGGGARLSSSATLQIQRQPNGPESPNQICGAGEINGEVQMCCHPDTFPVVGECDDISARTFDGCWEKSAQDERALEVCRGLTNFARCQCLERHRSGMCTCGGLV